MADGVVGTQNRRMSRVEGMLRLEVGDFCACGDGES